MPPNKRRQFALSAVAGTCLSLSSTGNVVATLKTAYRGGATQVGFDPVDFITRLADLATSPRANLTCPHVGFKPNHRWRELAASAAAEV